MNDERYFKCTQPHINLANTEAELAFLPGPPERALAVANDSSPHKEVTEPREFVTYKGEKEIVLCYPKTKQES